MLMNNLMLRWKVFKMKMIKIEVCWIRLESNLFDFTSHYEIKMDDMARILTLSLSDSYRNL